MSEELVQAKALLRGKIRAQLKTISPTHRAVASAQMCARFKAADIWRTAGTVLLFAPLPDEPDIWPLLLAGLAEHKRVALPYFDPAQQSYLARQILDPLADLEAGRYDVREPAAHCPDVPLNQLDLTLVPGVAFAPGGHRLGRGKGFYDRLLGLAGGVKCGVAYDEQIVAEIPTAPHDVVLNCILTPTRLL